MSVVSTSTDRSELDGFVRAFFGTGNEARTDDRYVAPWLERLRADPPEPVVLPYVHGGKTTWFGVARTAGQYEELRERLHAFVGPALATIEAARALDPAQPHEAALARIGGPRVVVLFPEEDGAQKVQAALALMLRVTARKTLAPLDDLRPTSRVLRDFHAALRAGDRQLASTALDVLRSRPEISEVNARFLEVQLLADLGRWEDLAAHRELADLAGVRRPRAVSRAVLVALYRVHIAPFEARCDLDGARAAFAGAFSGALGGFLGAAVGLDVPEIVKLQALHALREGRRADDLRDAALGAENRAWVEAILAAGTPTPVVTPAPALIPADPLAAARALLVEGRFEAALEQAASAPPSLSRAQALFRCAFELDRLDAEAIALEAWAALPPDEQAAIRRVRAAREILDRTTTPSKPIAPRNWLEWFDALGDESWLGAEDAACRGAREWTQAELGADAAIALARKLVGDNPALVAQRLDLALPHLVGFVLEDAAFPRLAWRELYRSLTLLLALSSNGNVALITLHGRIFSGLLELGLDMAAYADLLEETRSVWATYASPAILAWVLEALDSLLEYPCPLPDRRREFSLQVASRVATFDPARVPPTRWDAIESLLREAGAGELGAELRPRVEEAAAAEESGAAAWLQAAFVGVATLTERAGRQAKDILVARYPGIRVELNHDKVGTPRLESLARNCDLFVKVWRSAKHAADEVVKRVRTGPVAFAQGRGHSSIVSAVEEFASAR